MKKIILGTVMLLLFAACEKSYHEPSTKEYTVTVINPESTVWLSALYWNWIESRNKSDTVVFNNVPGGQYFLSINGERTEIKVDENLVIRR